jgi:aspartyl-tRNA(Asn)/glutamyl-tRNA(Gln) amidotransferase subunit C
MRGMIESIMVFTEQDLDNLSKLARIDISPQEKAKMLKDMQAILGYVSEINEIETESFSLEHDLNNVVREDVVRPFDEEKRNLLLKNAPKIEGDYVEVMQVLK